MSSLRDGLTSHQVHRQSTIRPTVPRVRYHSLGRQRAMALVLTVVGAVMSSASVAYAEDRRAPNDAWWNSFNDTVLSELVEEGLANNYDLRAGAARAKQAQASKWQALTPTLPSVSLDFNGSSAPLNSLGFAFGGLPGGDPNADEPTIFDPYFTGSAMVNARITADLGTSIFNFRASGLEAGAAETDVVAQGSALALRIASAYFDVVAAQAQVEVIERQINSNRSLVELVQLRYERGESTALDVLQQRQQLQSAEAQLPLARSQARVLRFQLGLLVGRDGPVALDKAAKSFPVLAEVPSRERVGGAIDSRPDLAAARKRLDAAESRVTAAWLNFLPRISLSGNTGYQGSWFDLDGEPNTLFTWGASAGISIPIVSGLSRYSGLRTNQAAALSARATYEAQRRQRLIAVEQARVQEEEFRLQLAAAKRQVDAANLTAEKSREQYLAGLAPLTSVLIATTSAQAGELNVLNIQRRVLDARVQLLDALGGDWAFDIAPPAPIDDVAAAASFRLFPLQDAAPDSPLRVQTAPRLQVADAPSGPSPASTPTSPSHTLSAVAVHQGEAR